MGLPTFICIGVPRAGTTWLHELLAEHPAVFVPSRRKELFFFDLHYHRGLNWYRKFFPADSDTTPYRAIGEITPFYLYGPDCPERIAQLPVGKLILMLRNPVQRAWSYYAHMTRNGAFWGTFEEFLAHPKFSVVEHGYYGKYLQRYLRCFRPEQILVLVFEHVMADKPRTKQSIADFLGIASTEFPDGAGERIVNASAIPKARRAYSIAFAMSRLLRKWDLDLVVNTAKRVGVKELFGVGGRVPPMARETGERLRRLYEPDMNEVEQRMGISLAVWREATEL
jgi:hypothetical protein